MGLSRALSLLLAFAQEVKRLDVLAGLDSSCKISLDTYVTVYPTKYARLCHGSFFVGLGQVLASS